MEKVETAQDGSLEDFEELSLTFDGIGKRVWRSGSGPAVIVMAEMPGITPHVLRFARWVRDAGMTVWLPSLFGTDGAEPTAEHGAEVFRRACVSAEFRALGGGGTSSPVTQWLMALARHAFSECGGAGVGTVGMCFTGNFALTMMLEPAVLAPVLCQPALPLDNPAGLEISADELSQIKERLDREGRKVMAYRFKGDAFCRAERFAAYAAALGDGFVEHVLPDEAAHKEPPSFYAVHVPTPHSVVTAHLIDGEGQPTIRARDEIIEFLKRSCTEERS
ncbi:dienelactone hydrolase [Sphingomonas sp. UYAg733]